MRRANFKRGVKSSARVIASRPLTPINHCVIYIALVQKLILAQRSRMNYTYQ
jgi:hypothetical protein